MDSLKFPRSLFWATVAIIALTIIVYYFIPEKEHPPLSIATEKQPTIGSSSAKVHVVVFEEPLCSHCKKFTLNVFPKIKKDYIDTGKIRFTVIPVSFLSGSMPSAVALLCAQAQNNDLFFSYLHTLYEKMEPNIQPNLMALAKQTSPKLNGAKLKVCLEKNTYRKQIEDNTHYGTVIMGRLTTPAVFVDGVLVDDNSFEVIAKKIKMAIKNRGEK